MMGCGHAVRTGARRSGALKRRRAGADEAGMSSAVVRTPVGSIATEKRASGFTVIEMMVALTLLTVGMLGLAPVFIASNRSASSAMHRTRAFELATRDLEAFRSIPYCSLGYPNYAGQPGNAVEVASPPP